MNQDNLTTVITNQGHAQDIAMLDQLSIPVDQLVAALDEVVTRPLAWREEKEENDKEAKDPEQQAKQLAAADVIAVDIPMAASEGSLQNIDTSYQSGYSGYDGGSEGLPPVAVFGLGLLAVVGIAAALSGGGGSSSKGGNNPPVNNDPILDNIQSPIATNEDQPVTFNVSSNDADGDTIETTFTANNGTVNAVVGNPGQFEYTPNADFNGQDQITVEVSDDRGGFDSQTITVNVSAVNDAPRAPTLTSQTAKGQTVEIDATRNVVDPEGDEVTYQLGDSPEDGSVNIIPDSPGQFEYIPNQGFSGTDEFTVIMTDENGASGSRTIQVQVGGNIAPEADAEQSVPLEEDTPTIIDIGATDANGDTLSYEITALPDNGSVESTGVPGEFEYTPNANFSGSDSFTVTVTDGNGGSVTQTVNLTITAVNDAPEADAFQNVTSPEGASVDIQVDATDVDDDDDTLTYTVITDPANGTVVNNGNGSFTYTPTDGDFIGQDSFEVEISDGDDTTTQEVRITVNADNDAPQVDATQDVSTESAAPVTITVNATDAEGDTLSYGAGAATNGSVVPGSAPGQFIYRPDAGFDGEDSFDVFVSDGNGGVSTQTVTVTVADSEGTEYDLTPIPALIPGLTDDADIIRGSVSDTGSTLNAGDIIDGQGGFDSLQISQSVNFGPFGGANPLAPGSMSNVEGLEISNSSDPADVNTFDAEGVSGLQYLKLAAGDRSFDFDNLSDTNLTFEIADADSLTPSGASVAPTLSYSLNFAGDTNDGEDDSLTLILNDVGRRNTPAGRPDDGIEVIAAAIEHLTVVAKSGQNYIDLRGITEVQTLSLGGTGDLDTLFFNGAGSTAPNMTFSDLSVVDGSSALGDLTLALYSNAPMTSLSTGFGDDVVEAGSNIRTTTTLNGGDGDDLLLLSNIGLNGAPNNTVTLAPTMMGFETVDLKVADNIDTFTFSAADITGLQTIQISDEGINDSATLPDPVITTIRDLDSQALTLSFFESDGVQYAGNDTYIVQDSGNLTITTTSENDNSTGDFADTVQAIAAPEVNLQVGRDTLFTGIIEANAADTASISLAAGGTIDGATLSVTSADQITIDGADDTLVTDLELQGNNVTNLNINGSVKINVLAPSNLNNLQTLTSTSLGGINLTDGGSGVGQFSQFVTVTAEDSVIGIETDLDGDGNNENNVGLVIDIAAYVPTNGGANVAGSTILKNGITIGAGRDQITVTGGSDDDRVTLGEIFEAGDGAVIDISLGNGLNDTLTLADGDNVITALTLSGVEVVKAIADVAGTPPNEADDLDVNASSVSGQAVTFIDFADIIFRGTGGDDTIDMENVDTSAISGDSYILGLAGDDIIIGSDGDEFIEGGAGGDTLTGRLGTNTYVYNTGDAASGERINFNSNSLATEKIEVETSTDFSELNNGEELVDLDEVSIAEGQTATFLLSQLTGAVDAEISGEASGELERFTILGTNSANTIDLESLEFTVKTATDIEIAINAGGGADQITAKQKAGLTHVYIFNANDVAVGETITFNTITTTPPVDNIDVFEVETSTDFSNLNGGNSILTGLDRIELHEGQSATFNAIQLSGVTLSVFGDGAYNGGETITVMGTALDDEIDLSSITVDDRPEGQQGQQGQLGQHDVSFEIYGREDDDRIIGTNGDDLIEGAGGLDTIAGGAGADSLYGGANSDTFFHSLGDGVGPTATADLGANGLSNGDEIGFGNGVDKIFDFTDGSDFIELDGISGAQLTTEDATQAFDVDLVDFGLTDDEYVVIRGNFDGTNDDVFYVNDQGDDLLFAFDANPQTNANPGIDTVTVEFIGLIGLGGVEFDASDVLV